MPDSFADLAEELSPSVVNISSTQKVKSSGIQDLKKLFPKGHPFEDFNEFFKRFELPQSSRQATSLGSGFIIDAQGHVVTNNHVVQGAEEIEVTFLDDRVYKAEVVGRDEKTDLAVLKITNADRKFDHVKFGDSDEARVGDWIIAIGNPFGLGGTVTAGIISARARNINAGPYDDFIQTDAAINRGNSGGPMFDVEGDVIGINSAIYSPSGGNVGIGFAIPVNMAKPIIEQLKQGKTVQRGWLGVKIQTVTEDIAESLGRDDLEGALVAEVTESSPAEKAGFKVGDLILRFDGEKIKNMRTLPKVVASTKVNKDVKVKVLRDGKDKTLSVVLGELKEDKVSVKELQEKGGEKEKIAGAEKLLELSVVVIDATARDKYKLEEDAKGLLVLRVDPDSDAAIRGVQAGDIIVEIGQKKVASIKAAKEAVSDAEEKGRKTVLLLVRRDGGNIFIPVSIEKD
jgi:serine protease Do